MDGRRTVASTGGAVAGGGVVALQLHANGELGSAIGSATLAGVFAFGSGVAVLLITAPLLADLRPSVLVQRHRNSRWWWFMGGVTSAVFVMTAAAAAPLMGLTLLTMALVLGQLVGSLVVDRLGLSPHGRAGATRLRLLAAMVGVVALVVSNGGVADLKEPLTTLGMVAVGAGVALGVAANGQLRRLYGNAAVAALTTMSVALGSSLLVVAVTIGMDVFHGGWRLPVDGTPHIAWMGGIFGAVWLTASAALVRRLGVLRLLLAGLTGQLIGSLVLDAIAPLSASPVNGPRLIGVTLMVLAVTLASLPSSKR